MLVYYSSAYHPHHGARMPGEPAGRVLVPDTWRYMRAQEDLAMAMLHSCAIKGAIPFILLSNEDAPPQCFQCVTPWLFPLHSLRVKNAFPFPSPPKTPKTYNNPL